MGVMGFTVPLSVIATLRMPRPGDRDDYDNQR